MGSKLKPIYELKLKICFKLGFFYGSKPSDNQILCLHPYTYQALTIKLQPKLIHCCVCESRCLTTHYISIPLPLSILKLKLNLPLNSNLNSNLLSLELDLSLNLNNWIRFYGFSNIDFMVLASFKQGQETFSSKPVIIHF